MIRGILMKKTRISTTFVVVRWHDWLYIHPPSQSLANQATQATPWSTVSLQGKATQAGPAAWGSLGAAAGHVKLLLSSLKSVVKPVPVESVEV